MSCFIVSNECMRRALLGISSIEFSGALLVQSVGVHLVSSRPGEGDRRMTDLGRAIFKLNGEAFRHCYANRHPCVNPGETDFTFKRTDFSPVGLNELCDYIKALECVIHQCSEGDCEMTQLYGGLVDALHGLRAYAVSQLPAYEAAAWG